MKKEIYLNRIWNFFLQQQLKNFREILLKKEALEHLKKTKILKIDDDEIIFDVHNIKVIDFLKKNNLINKFLMQIQGEAKKVIFQQKAITTKENTTLMPTLLSDHKQVQPVILNLDKTVVIGDFNRKIIEIIERTLNGEKIWSPLFIHSASGLGKTSILHLIERAYTSNKVCYISALDFISDFFEKLTMSVHEIEEWKKQFAEYQVYLFDDVHLFANKNKTNEVLFQIISRAIQNNKIIVFTAEIHPENFIGFEKRLISRFQQGLILEIKKPDLPVSVKIIRQKGRMFCPKMKITDGAINAIAQHFSHDIRKLEGVIKRIAFQWEFENLEDKPVDLEFIKRIFGEKNWTKKAKLTARQIFNLVVDYYNLSQKDLLSISKKQKIVMIRYLGMYLIRQLTIMSYEKIARVFNIKSHATVLNAIKKIKKLNKTDRTITKDVQILTKKCQKINQN